jgi:superkiller protein 3
LASYFLYTKDYEAASETSRASIEVLRNLREDAALIISAPETALLITLATSLIHYQAPKHHPQARKLFDAILARKPDSIEALVGNGRVALDAGNLEEAFNFTSRALELNPHHVEAKMEHAWALVLLNDIENGKQELEETLPLIDGRDPHSRDTIAEIWWRIGKCYWDQGYLMTVLCLHLDSDNSKTEAYAAFVTCLKYNQNYPPAYTSLGFFYSEVVNDLSRAFKCFQKAFEMDAGEAEAAEQLARNFADTRQWELVEVVARRVLQASRTRLSTRRELSWPHRALGVAELVLLLKDTANQRTSGIIQKPYSLFKLL